MSEKPIDDPCDDIVSKDLSKWLRKHKDSDEV